MNLTNNRLVIINKYGAAVDYPIITGQMHQDCIEDYCTKENYEYKNRDSILANAEAIFYNAGNGMIIGYLPNKLNDSQLTMLDLLSLSMKNISYLSVRRYGDSGYVDYTYTSDIGDSFSREVLQSYYIIDNSKTILLNIGL